MGVMTEKDAVLLKTTAAAPKQVNVDAALALIISELEYFLSERGAKNSTESFS